MTNVHFDMFVSGLIRQLFGQHRNTFGSLPQQILMCRIWPHIKATVSSLGVCDNRKTAPNFSATSHAICNARSDASDPSNPTTIDLIICSLPILIGSVWDRSRSVTLMWVNITLLYHQRANASSSSTLAATHAAPLAEISRFQNGARDLR
jgi:hypothetical protein